MKIEVLKTKAIGHRNWYLCQGNLLEYLESLKPSFYDFAIQRRIVHNQYLDYLYQTVQSGDPIPMITLTYNNPVLEVSNSAKAEIDMMKVEILDGLQRTFRLWCYKILSDRYKGETDKSIIDFAKKLKEENELFFESGVISTGLIRSLIANGEINRIRSVFNSYEIFFIVWAGLEEEEVIDKMLVLNAGQKAVTKTHQFELLFLHYYDNILQQQKDIRIFREKDRESTNIKKGNRNLGEFMFSSIIVALQSFVEMRPLRISTDDFTWPEEDVETASNVYKSVFSIDFIDYYLKELYQIDEIVNKSDSVLGKEWFVKDTTLSGVFAAVGKYININNEWNKDQLADNAATGFSCLKQKITATGFDLPAFTKEYNVLSSRQVNIGNFIRKAIMNYTYDLLQGYSPEWNAIFEKTKERR